jgi:nucleoside-diphosphate-sugar epimerase
MKVLVTGGTGLVGNAIARRLVERGHQVTALVRDPNRAKRLLPAEVELATGDITAPSTIAAAMPGQEWVFHAAGMPEQWQPDAGIFERVNAQGTANVLDAALAASAGRVVYTSTMDVFEAPAGGTVIETRIDQRPKGSAYERSKQQAERYALRRLERGLDLVIVNPGAVYGPGPVHVALNGFFIQLLNGKLPMVPPGGFSVSYVDRVADAQLAAAERGRRGERYLLTDTYASMADLAGEIARQAGLQRIPPTAPAWLLKLVTNASAPLARQFGFAPPVAPGQLVGMLWAARADSTKAQQELDFKPMPLAEGVGQTIEFLRAEGLAPK